MRTLCIYNENELTNALNELSRKEFTELDFEPIRPRDSFASDLIREVKG